jgi:monothiol glutaredoxin
MQQAQLKLQFTYRAPAGATTVDPTHSIRKLTRGKAMATTEERILDSINTNSVLLFMKGTPAEPKCGFSSRAVAALKAADINFAAIDVLAAPRIRETLPRVSKFPTFPQLFVNGELVGGSDIVQQMIESGELQRMIAAAPTRSESAASTTKSQAAV